MDTTLTEPKKALNLAERVKELKRELRDIQGKYSQLAKENQILEEVAAFFAARRKKSGNI